MTGRRRFIVVDPGLTGPEGHHLHYSEAIAEAALARGMTPVVLSGRGFTGTIANGRITCRPSFTARYQTSGGGGWPRQALFTVASRLPSGLAASVAPPIRQLRRQLRRVAGSEDMFGPELGEALAGIGDTADDLAILHSVSAANLATLPDAVPAGRIGNILVVLRRPPDDMDTDDPGPLPIAALLRRLDQVYGSKLLLFADTEALAEIFQDSAGLAVRVVPPPVSVPETIATASHPRDAPPHLVFIGGARLEKNYHHLPAIVAACHGRARFTIHAGRVDAGSDPLLQRAHRELQGLAGPSLHLVEQALPPEEYWTLLSGADLVLLPYDRVAYGPRSSGILVESLALGVPALVPAGCWMEHAGAAFPAGSPRTMAMTNIEDAPEAAARALLVLPELTEAARAGRDEWRHAHSAGALLDCLLEPLPSRVAN